MDAVLDEVSQRITAEGLSRRLAATQIGVTLPSLERHLSGGYVRSDSLARYRAWLSRTPHVAPTRPRAIAPTRTPDDRDDTAADVPMLPWKSALPDGVARRRVVDLFAGCGGMSLGFDLLGDGAVFDTTLALDLDDAMVRAWNANRPSALRPACRRVDLVAFDHEAEVLAFYLDHLAARESDADLAHALTTLPGGPLDSFHRAISALDERFVRESTLLRARPAFVDAWRRVASVAQGQTSVAGFCDALSLPLLARPGSLGPLPWTGAMSDESALDAMASRMDVRRRLARTRRDHARAWDDEVARLVTRANVRGARGQLASSAGRIGAFVGFLRDPAVVPLQRAWLAWRSLRQALRDARFDDEPTRRALERAYDRPDRRVDVVLGGPPCQGFSRIGRGKIRSLREHGVHVHEDAATGDRRNRLLHKYVLFVSALAPRVFLFENVRHFQARVATEDGAGYLATDVLADAIRAVSRARLEYGVSMRTVDCARHLLPQTRERFVMAGVRGDASAAAAMLDLRARTAIPLGRALDDLPDALDAAGRTGADLARTVTVPDAPTAARTAYAHYHAWIRQRVPTALASTHSCARVDAHAARVARRDDADLFARFGPGMRWMDYRCDDAPTLRELTTVLDALAASKRLPTGIAADTVASLRARLDGSLALRLVLESIVPLPGETVHHLAAPAYLSKRDGNHGDWLARLDARRPCKTIVSHMGKDTYAYVHPSAPRGLSVREAARIQGFPDWFAFGALSLVDAFRVIGNAVPPIVSHQFAARVAARLASMDTADTAAAG